MVATLVVTLPSQYTVRCARWAGEPLLQRAACCSQGCVSGASIPAALLPMCFLQVHVQVASVPSPIRTWCTLDGDCLWNQPLNMLHAGRRAAGAAPWRGEDFWWRVRRRRLPVQLRSFFCRL